MSEATRSTRCHYLEKTKIWFNNRFQQDWNEELWKSIGLANLVQEERDTFIFCVGNTLHQETAIEAKFIGKYAGELFDILIKKPEKGGDNELFHLEQQFGVEYRGQVQKKLMRMINCYYDKWVLQSSKAWHSPYISIVQSSGFGKSRACKEIATTTFDENKNWLSFFICCRDSKWKGYPPQTKPAVDFFNSLLTKTPSDAVEITTRWIKWLVYFRFVFRLAFLKFKNKETKRIKERESNKDKLEIIVKNVTDIEISSLLKEWRITKFERMQFDREKESMERKAFWSICFEKCHQDLMMQMFNFINFKTMSKTDPGMFKEMLQNKKTLVVIDEARFLSNSKLVDHSGYALFRVFRSALKGFDTGLIAVVVDTQSQIANFAPSRHLDPSLRVTGKSDHNYMDLFHPFTAVTTTDVLCDPNSNLDDAKYRFILGRPLWKVTLDLVNGSISQLHEFALSKLFGGIPFPNDTGKIACIAVLTGINILPISTIARNLVASHMATCLAIDSGRESLLITYPVEPILAEAAKSYVKERHCCKELFKVFEPLQSCFQLGVIDRGHNGELVAKLLILLGMFQTSDTGTVMISRQKVLRTLFGNTFINKKNKSMFTFEDEFFFNCFTQIFRKKEYWKESDAQVELASFFNRGAAIQLPAGHIGADLLLPIRRKSVTGKSGTEKYSYFYLLVQIKNYKRNVCPYIMKKCTEMLDRTFEKETSWARCNIGWSIIMNVGQEREEAYWYGETSIQNKKGSGGKPVDASISQSKYFVVNGIGQASYPKLLKGQSLLIAALLKMLREPSFDEWIDHGGKYPMSDHELDFCSFVH
jgi:hypothetical protein